MAHGMGTRRFQFEQRVTAAQLCIERHVKVRQRLTGPHLVAVWPWRDGKGQPSPSLAPPHFKPLAFTLPHSPSHDPWPSVTVPWLACFTHSF